MPGAHGRTATTGRARGTSRARLITTKSVFDLLVPVNSRLLLEDVLELEQEVLVVSTTLLCAVLVQSGVGRRDTLGVLEVLLDLKEAGGLQGLHTRGRLGRLNALVGLKLEVSGLRLLCCLSGVCDDRCGGSRSLGLLVGTRAESGLLEGCEHGLGVLVGLFLLGLAIALALTLQLKLLGLSFLPLELLVGLGSVSLCRCLLLGLLLFVVGLLTLLFLLLKSLHLGDLTLETFVLFLCLTLLLGLLVLDGGDGGGSVLLTFLVRRGNGSSLLGLSSISLDLLGLRVFGRLSRLGLDGRCSRGLFLGLRLGFSLALLFLECPLDLLLEGVLLLLCSHSGGALGARVLSTGRSGRWCGSIRGGHDDRGLRCLCARRRRGLLERDLLTTIVGDFDRAALLHRTNKAGALLGSLL